MLVTAEFNAAPMKYVISNAEGLEDLVTAPNRIWTIPAGDGQGGGGNTQVGQFGAADAEQAATPPEGDGAGGAHDDQHRPGHHEPSATTAIRPVRYTGASGSWDGGRPRGIVPSATSVS